MPVARKLPRNPSLEEGAAVLQKKYARRLSPPLEGLAYRFTIWLPVQSHGKPVFTKADRTLLFDLFLLCFGGYSRTALEGFPPWSGFWLPEEASEPMVDDHILLVVYTLQDSAAIAFMRQLKWLLQQHHVAAQQIVLIEQVPVQFVEAAELA
jgi:hypothetical protein